MFFLALSYLFLLLSSFSFSSFFPSFPFFFFVLFLAHSPSIIEQYFRSLRWDFCSRRSNFVSSPSLYFTFSTLFLLLLFPSFALFLSISFRSFSLSITFKLLSLSIFFSFLFLSFSPTLFSFSLRVFFRNGEVAATFDYPFGRSVMKPSLCLQGSGTVTLLPCPLPPAGEKKEKGEGVIDNKAIAFLFVWKKERRVERL